jgi:hypothetical protein
MRNIFLIILLLLFAFFSGCIGSKTPYGNAQSEDQKFDLADPNLDARIVEVKLSPPDVRAGEEVSADLIVASIGTEKITNETIDIKAMVNTLDDFVGNLALKMLSEDQKTKTYTMSYDEEIQPGMVKSLSAIFRTPQEMQGRNLAGTYSVTITLSVNGQKVESKVVPITLHSGNPRMQNESKSTTPVPTEKPEPTVTPLITQAPTPILSPIVTPEPTPESVTVAPTGIINTTRIRNNVFPEPTLTLYAGNQLQWNNFDDETYTLSEMDNKISNITVPDMGRSKNVLFNTTGTFKLGLYYNKMRGGLKIQTIIVKLNATT